MSRVGKMPVTVPSGVDIDISGTSVTVKGTKGKLSREFSDRVREKLTTGSGLAISAPADRFEAQANRDALVELSGALKVLAVSLIKIGNDLALRLVRLLDQLTDRWVRQWK